MPKILGLGFLALFAASLVIAASTKPSKADLQAAATAYADKTSIVGSVATRVTGVFGNDAYDDYIFFVRYRVYVGKSPTVDCFGAFGKTACQTPKADTQTEGQS